MELPLISVIVPVYNVETFLDECLQSIVQQTYDNLEIIAVDDGSTDTSGEKCDMWAKRDPRIRVIHKENGGLSDARNAGLMTAKGSLIGFVDSDDVIHPYMYQGLYELMQIADSEISCCRMRKSNSFENMFTAEKNCAEIKRYTPEEALRAIITESDVFVTVWNKLYRRDIIGDIQFELNKCHEDEFWSYQVIAGATRIVTSDQCYYGYRQRENSIMNQQYSLKRLDLLMARTARLSLIERRFPDLAALARCDLRFECIRAQQFSFIFLKEEELEISKQIIQDIVHNHPLRYCDYHSLPLGRQVWCFLSNIAFAATCHIRNKFHFGP